MMTISAAQIRAARGLLNWSQTDLAAAACLSRPTIDRAERTGISSDALAAIQRALEVAGVEFIAENGGGAGVRLRKGS
ncbi:XRE family transcriptional regulator [Ancylobacter aquaticus]|nr:XRE family transcriptional regulator [Ancylobacter aquaticus]